MVNYDIGGRCLFDVTAGRLILLAVVHEPLLQSPLQAPFLRYLGRI